VEFVAKTCLADPEPTEYVTSVDGRIVVEMPQSVRPKDVESEKDTPAERSWVRHDAGRVALTVFHLARAEHDRQSLFEVFDCIDDENFGIFRQLYTEHGEFRPELEDLVDRHDVIYPSLLVIESMELLPRFRGWGLGLAVVLKAMHLFGPSGGLVALVAGPVSRPFDREGGGGTDEEVERWRRRMRIDAFAKQDPEKACVKLGAYWSKLGFKRVETVEDSWLYVRGLGVPLPKVEDLIKQGEGGASN
jgi:hypothetical protein